MRKRLVTIGMLAFTFVPVFVPGVVVFAQATRDQRGEPPPPPEPMPPPPDDVRPRTPPPPPDQLPCGPCEAPPQSVYCASGVNYGYCN